MHEARLRADDLGEVRQEGDDVVLHLALDGVDARDIEDGVAALLPYLGGRFLRHEPDLGHGVEACASISNQMRNLVSGDQIAAISGRL